MNLGNDVDELLRGIDQETSDRVWRLHLCGYAPSRIDAMLHLSPGRAHDEVVWRWWCDRYGNPRTREQ